MQSSELTGAGSLEKIGTGTFSLGGYTAKGNLTVSQGAVIVTGPQGAWATGGTVTVNVNGGLEFGNQSGLDEAYWVGALSGTGNFSLVDPHGDSIDLIVGGNNADTTYSGAISGTYNAPDLGGSVLAKVGTGTLTLTGTNTFPQLYVDGGTVNVTGSIANNGSGWKSPSLSVTFIAAGADFSTASLVRRVQPGASYAGFGASTSNSTANGVPYLFADVRAGMNELATPADLAMQWRVPNANDTPRLVSRVFKLSGMSAALGDHVQTGTYALQMTYNPALLGGNEALIAANGLLDLVYLDQSQNQPNGLWVNATLGNFGTGMPGDVFQNYQGSWDAFAAGNGVTDANVGNFLGSYGVDAATHTVWAVVNFNGQFSVVPEPPTALLLSIAAAILLTLPRSRKRLRRLTATVVVIFVASGLPSRSGFAGTSGTWIDTTSGGNWFDKSNWSGGTIPNGTDAIADFSTLDIMTDNIVTQPVGTVGTLIFGDATPSNNWTITGTSRLTLATSTGIPTIQVTNQTATIDADVISPQGLRKTGDGRLVLLRGFNSIPSGPLTIDSGSVQFQDGTKGNFAGITVNSDAGLVFGPSTSPNPLFQIPSLSGSGSFSLSDTSGSPVALTVSAPISGSRAAYSGVMSGIGSLTVVGGSANSPALTLAGANTLTGNTTIGDSGFGRNGYLQIGNSNALQNSAVTDNYGTITFSPGIGTFTFAGLSIPAGSPSNGLSLTDTAGAPVVLVVGNNNASTTCSNLTGNGALVKNGTGTLTLVYSTLSGGVTVNAGALQIESYPLDDPKPLWHRKQYCDH